MALPRQLPRSPSSKRRRSAARGRGYDGKVRILTRLQIEGAALIGIDVAKEDDLGEWYQQVITKGQMISYYDVSLQNFSILIYQWLTDSGRRMVYMFTLFF